MTPYQRKVIAFFEELDTMRPVSTRSRYPAYKGSCSGDTYFVRKRSVIVSSTGLVKDARPFNLIKNYI